ncbi:MAG: hypothetical protein IJ620_03380 [Bacteroidales bacterium]|nr:hypothetical protein [Bacteroidales bacterium]
MAWYDFLLPPLVRQRRNYERDIKLREQQDADNHFCPPELLRMRKSIPINIRGYAVTKNMVLRNDMDFCDDPDHPSRKVSNNDGVPVRYKYAIYCESSFSAEVNNYIENHFDDISKALFRVGFTFLYIPRILAEINASADYISPQGHPQPKGHFSVEEFYSTIYKHIVRLPDSDVPMLLFPMPGVTPGYPKDMLDSSMFPCYFCKLNYINDSQFDYILKRQIDTVAFDTRQFNARHWIDGDADNDTIDRISSEIRLRINQLYALGVTDYVIRQLVQLPEPQISHVCITPDFRIILTDYGDMEIQMPPLSKAIWLLYLRHPEGLLFKQLVNHRQELYNIYSILSPREDVASMNRSIDDIIDSTKNSVNEKVSRIKAAFVTRIHDSLASNYYLVGKAGEPKQIRLDRSFITDQSGLLSSM